MVLAVCGGGGNDTLAFIVVLAIAALYLLPIVATLGNAEDGAERAVLIVLLAISITVGGLLFLYPQGIDGDQDYLGRFVISLLVTGGIAVAAAAKWRAASVGRAVFVALAGDVLIPGGIFLLFFASMVLGSGCLS